MQNKDPISYLHMTPRGPNQAQCLDDTCTFRYRVKYVIIIDCMIFHARMHGGIVHCARCLPLTKKHTCRYFTTTCVI